MGQYRTAPRAAATEPDIARSRPHRPRGGKRHVPAPYAAIARFGRKAGKEVAYIESNPLQKLIKFHFPFRFGVADEHDVGSCGEERKVEQAQDAGLGLHTALVMLEVKGIDAGLSMQARESETPFNGALRAGFDFHVGEPFQGSRRAGIPGGRVEYL